MTANYYCKEMDKAIEQSKTTPTKRARAGWHLRVKISKKLGGRIAKRAWNLRLKTLENEARVKACMILKARQKFGARTLDETGIKSDEELRNLFV